MGGEAVEEHVTGAPLPGEEERGTGKAVSCELSTIASGFYGTVKGVGVLGPSDGEILFGCMARVTLDIPEELSAVLSAHGEDLPRAVIESLALEAYRERKLTTAQLRRVLGFESRYELDGFLKAHEVWLDYGLEDLERDREAHRKLGL